jgi:linoleoyl-CoA desaturase
MQTIKFVTQDKGQFTATLRKNVNDYFKQKGISTKGNSRMLIKSIIMLGMYLIPFTLLLIFPVMGWLSLALWAVMGIGMAGIGMGVMHDAAHSSFSKKGWINKLFSHTMYIIGGNTFNWKVQHNVLHHTYTNISGLDEDIEPKGSMRLSAQSPLKKIHRFQHVYAFFLYSLMSLSRMVSEFGQLHRYNKKGLTKAQGSTPKKEMWRLVIGKALYIAAIIGLPVIFGWNIWMVVLGFVLMHLIAGLLMSTVFQMAHVVEEATQPLPAGEGVIQGRAAGSAG